MWPTNLQGVLERLLAAGKESPPDRGENALCMDGLVKRLIGRSRSGSSSAGTKQAGPLSGADPGQAVASGQIASFVTWDEFGGIAWSVHNTVVGSYCEMCVQCRPSTGEHSDLFRGEFGIRSRGAAIRESAAQDSLDGAFHSATSNDRAKVHVGVGTIEEWLNYDIRVSKYLCSRCALNVSYWGVLWHPVSNLGTRKLLITEVNP
jgi:hypothetical protein